MIYIRMFGIQQDHKYEQTNMKLNHCYCSNYIRDVYSHERYTALFIDILKILRETMCYTT